MAVTNAAPSGVFQTLPLDRVIFGPGQVQALPQEVDRLGARRAFIITGQSLATRTDLVERAEELLGARHAGTFAETKQHVPSRGVIEAARQARQAGADLLVSFGGGSPADCAKLVALCLADDYTQAAQLNARADRTNREPPSRPPVPVIAVATTLSAGEFTGSAGVTNEEQGFKGGYGHPSLAPRVVIFDPELALATPNQLWASTGLKAVDHAVERLYNPRRQPYTAAVCGEALRLLLQHLPPSVADGPDLLSHRGSCQIGAWLSMAGANNDGTGLSHAIGHQLGARCGVPHGVTSCITMPHVVRFFGRTAPDMLRDLAAALGLEPDDVEAGETIADRLSEFVQGMGLPYRLRDANVPKEQIEPLAANVVHELQGRAAITEDQLVELLSRAW